MPDSIPEGAGQEIDEYDRAVEDNFSNAYLKRREAFGVINSPAFRALETLHIEPQEGPDSTTEPKEGQEAVSHEPVIHPADAYLAEKFPEPIESKFPKIRANVGLSGNPGEIPQEWREVWSILSEGLKDPNRDISKKDGETWAAPITRALKKYLIELPKEALVNMGDVFDRAMEDPNSVAPLDYAQSTFDAALMGVFGGGKGVANQIKGLPLNKRKAAEKALIKAYDEAGKQADDVLGFSKKPILEIMEGGADDAGSGLDDFVQRFEEPGKGRAVFDKPHGVYTSPASVESPHADLGGGQFFWRKNQDANVLRITDDRSVDIAMRNGTDTAGANVWAARELLGPDEFARLKKLPKKKLINEVSRRYPDVEWSRYYDAQEVMEGYGGLLARDAGYDAIELKDAVLREFDEYVGLTPNSMAPVDALPGKELPEFAGNINFSHIQTTDDAKALIDDVAKRFEGSIDESRRGVVSHEETARLAELTGMTPERLLARRKGEAFNAHEALAARQILVSSAENLSELAQKVTLGTATDMDRFAFRKQLSTHYALQAQVSGMTAEAGRALNAFRINAASMEGKQLAIKEMLASMDGKSTDQIAQMLSTMDTPEQIGKFVQDAQKATSFDMLLEAWINGLLSGPQTHMVNMTSNALVSLWMVPERLIASAFSKVPKLGSGEIQAKEALYQAYGLVEGFKDGLRAMGNTIKTGEAPDVIGKLEQGYKGAIRAENVKKTFIGSKFGRHLDEGTPLARAVDLMGEGVRLPGRFLEAEDALFKSVGYRMELRARAFRQASLEGLEGDAAATRIHQILSDPETFAPDIHLAAIDAARYQTFTQPLGQGGKAVQSALSAVPAAKFVVPFVRTPTNILKFAFERTPLAPLSKQFRAEIMAGGARRDLALAKVSMGSMVMAVGAAMAASGRITGGGPSNPAMRAHLRNQGWQEYSVKIGDKYVSYGRMEPIGMVFGLAADVADIMSQTDEMEASQIAVAATMAISKNMTSKTWLRGFSEALNAMEDPDRYGERWWQNFGASFTPNIITQTERSLSPEMSATYDFLDRVKAKIPGYSKDLPPRRNVWGEVQASGMGGLSTFLPTYISEKKDSPIDAEMFRLGMPAGMPGQNTRESGFAKEMNFNGVDMRLTPHEYDRFIVLMNETALDSTGITLKKSMNRLIKTADYKELDDDDKKTAIRRLFTEAKRRAKELLLEENPEIQSIINAELAKQGN